MKTPTIANSPTPSSPDWTPNSPCSPDTSAPPKRNHSLQPSSSCYNGNTVPWTTCHAPGLQPRQILTYRNLNALRLSGIFAITDQKTACDPGPRLILPQRNNQESHTEQQSRSPYPGRTHPRHLPIDGKTVQYGRAA